MISYVSQTPLLQLGVFVPPLKHLPPNAGLSGMLEVVATNHI